MKQTHSIFWFREHFQSKQLGEKIFCCYGTCNGYDYSFQSDSEEMAWLLAEAYLKKNGHVFDEMKNEVIALKDEIERNKKVFEKHMKEVGERFRSKLMSVYYLLDAISKTGTHRQKETVIVFQKAVIEDLINKGDCLPFDYQDGLPF